METGRAGTGEGGAVGYGIGIDAPKNASSHGRREEGKKYSSSCDTVNRSQQAEGTGTAAGLERIAETETGFAIHSQMPVVKGTNIFFMKMQW